MKTTLLLPFLLLAWTGVSAQSKTTEALHKEHKNATALFFYQNTLRMLNQKENKEFDEFIRDIEKMKFLIISKKPGELEGDDYKRLVNSYKKEAFEEVMTSRYNGKNFAVFTKEDKDRITGILILVNDSTQLCVLDIVGQIALNKVTGFYDALNESTEIGQKMKVILN